MTDAPPASKSTPPPRRKARFLGQFLLSEGYITAPQLLAALEYQEQFNARLGEYAVALGLLTLFDAQRINALQVSKDLLFGQAALELGLLNKEQVRQVMSAQRNDHVLLGEALCKLGYLDQETIARALGQANDVSDDNDPERLLGLPESLRARDVATKAFYLAHKLLPRLWDLQNKPSTPQLVTSTLLLSDRNASVTLHGDHAMELYLGVPHDVAERAVRVISGQTQPTDLECDEVVRDLLTTLCSNLRVTLASEGVSVFANDATTAPFKIALEDTQAIVVPFVTHQGQVIFALRPA